jgi:GMP synthase (glutamine-hydrolysing)
VMLPGTILDIIYCMSVLIIKNVAAEGAGTIERFLADNGISRRTVEIYREELPSAADFEVLVMLGGPMSVNETDIYPYISAEEELVREFIKKGKKIFGVCLGAQIMAKALGARVYPGREKEIGWHDIELLGEGLRDPLMHRLAKHPRAGDFWRRFKVFHWHGETFDIPAGAERLARSDLFANQAFRYGQGAYAFQFHIEVEKGTIYEWLKDEPVDMDVIRRETELLYEDYAGRAINFYRYFFKEQLMAKDGKTQAEAAGTEKSNK